MQLEEWPNTDDLDERLKRIAHWDDNDHLYINYIMEMMNDFYVPLQRCKSQGDWVVLMSSTVSGRKNLFNHHDCSEARILDIMNRSQQAEAYQKLMTEVLNLAKIKIKLP